MHQTGHLADCGAIRSLARQLSQLSCFHSAHAQSFFIYCGSMGYWPAVDLSEFSRKCVGWSQALDSSVPRRGGQLAYHPRTSATGSLDILGVQSMPALEFLVLGLLQMIAWDVVMLPFVIFFALNFLGDPEAYDGPWQTQTCGSVYSPTYSSSCL